MDYRNQDAYCDLCFHRCRGVYHVIEQGDTLYQLGQRYHVSVADIMRVNPYVNVYNLHIGEEICIPVKGPQPRTEEEYFDYSTQPQPIRMPQYNNTNGYTNGEYMDDMETPIIYEDRRDGMVEETQLEDDYESPLMIEDAPVPPITEAPNFSEEDTLKEVLEQLGITMEDLLDCVAQKTD